VQGPVTDWGSYFNLGSLTDWLSTPGTIQLDEVGIDHPIDLTFDGAMSACAADIDGDDDMDVIAVARDGREVAWWENTDGLGLVWTKHEIEDWIVSPHSVYPADIDGDNDIDVAGAASLYTDFVWWENLDGGGLSWTLHIVEDSLFGSGQSVHVNDIDNDGDLDIIGAAEDADEISWWENLDGSGITCEKHLVRDNFVEAYSVYSVDVDGDSIIDIIGAAREDDVIVWWKNLDGSGTSWVEHTVDTVNGASWVYADDIDLDGDIDILGTAWFADSKSSRVGEDVTWWENVDGSGTAWIAHFIDTSVVWSFCVHSADIDNDGDVDVLGAARSVHGISLYINEDGGGLVWSEYSLAPTYDYTMSVTVEDINDDGYPDVIGADWNDEVFWWDLDAFASAGFIESSLLYLGNDPGWGSIDWSCTVPVGTSVSFQVRASDDYGDMGTWSDTLTAPCSLLGILAENDSYFQYRAILQTSDQDTTPYLEDITLTWNPLGILEVESPVREYALYGALSNPASGSAALAFSIPEQCSVKLDIFDLSGRIVAIPADGSFSPGMHQVLLDGLPPGIYFCRMISGDFTATQRFVVIE
jgi:hypothetical protein